MKVFNITALSFLLCLGAPLNRINSNDPGKGIALPGAWSSTHATVTTTIIFSEKYFSAALYNVSEKTFAGTYGGSWKIEGKNLIETIEFNTLHPDQIGKQISIPFQLKDETLVLKDESWKHVDDGTPGELAGAWLITARYSNGELRTMTPGARRTMKILSGTRFQWIAYNVDTKEFFGTGGGMYTTTQGKYTENIEFFSRDSSRVGASLSFDYSLEDGKWHHQGFSSKGDPLDEVWSRRETIGI